MSRIERISGRLPRLYQAYENKSLFFILLQSIDNQLSELEDEITYLMKAHWADTANGTDLDKLAAIVGAKRISDDDTGFRRNIKRTVEEYQGGGTLSIIKKRIQELLNCRNADDFEIIENPRINTFAEFSVEANDTWTLGSNSIENEESALSLAIEGKGEVRNPQITNLDTGQSVVFNGKLESGKQLVIKKKRALLAEKDITEKVTLEVPIELSRKESVWKYSESLSEMIGIFDIGKFDEHAFAIGIPTVKVRFDWVKSQTSTFLIKIKKNVFRESGLTESFLEKTLRSIKAVGVRLIIKIME
jgi:hypothetical protein